MSQVLSELSSILRTAISKSGWIRRWDDRSMKKKGEEYRGVQFLLSCLDWIVEIQNQFFCCRVWIVSPLKALMFALAIFA
jgi:hypothetical protein